MDKGMRKQLLSQFRLGDMLARYFKGEENGQVELQLIPANREDDVQELKFSRGDSLVQVKLLGDIYPGSYAGGMTMRNSGTVQQCRFKLQETESSGGKFTIRTVLEDGRDHEFIHELIWCEGDAGVSSRITAVNRSSEQMTLEMLSSFSMSEMTPFQQGDAAGTLRFHRLRSKWSQEARLVTETIEDLQLEPNWVQWQPNSIRFGQVGSMPVKGYFPFAALEDTESNVTWGVQLAIESSWQLEIYRRDEGIALSGGLADREFGHWLKIVEPGQSFTTPEAILTVCTGGPDYACQRLTQFGEKYLLDAPESEEKLPILFNEYCTTWGLPSHDNITGIVEAIKGKGIDYFVIDCGWFVEEGKSWGDGMGDYIPSEKLFPEGMQQTIQAIRDAGMKPGLWFEIDNVGRDAAVYHRDELLLHRDGVPITTENRRYFDMRKPEVEAYLDEKVIGQLKTYGIEYMKMDYNDTIGLGCDGAESLGEGLRQNMEASMQFVRKVREELPGLVLENCASGGHKLEPLLMSLCSMASFSDAHETEEIPVIAAGLHRAILPRQSQVWAVIRKDDDLRRIAYTLTSTFLGRMCLSGDVTELAQEQWAVIERGMAFYRKIVPAVKSGYSYIFSGKGPSDRHLTGYQAVIRVQREDDLIAQGKELYEGLHRMAYVTVHIFHGEVPAVIEIPLPEGCPDRIADLYAGTDIRAEVVDRTLRIYPTSEMEAAAILLE
ncbi:Alpha-galactosidase [compost metagenome]